MRVNDYMTEYATEMKQADSTNLYRDIMIIRFRDASDLYASLLSKYAKIGWDEDLFNALLSELIVIMINVYQKLMGSGDKADDIIKEFEPYLGWMDDVSIPKIDIDEQKKVHKLYRLIVRAYDLLGFSNY